MAVEPGPGRPEHRNGKGWLGSGNVRHEGMAAFLERALDSTMPASS